MVNPVRAAISRYDNLFRSVPYYGYHPSLSQTSPHTPFPSTLLHSTHSTQPVTFATRPQRHHHSFRIRLRSKAHLTLLCFVVRKLQRRIPISISYMSDLKMWHIAFWILKPSPHLFDLSDLQVTLKERPACLFLTEPLH